MKGLFSLIRPLHWGKNLVIFAPVFFGGKLFEVSNDALLWLVFICFCMASSAVYALNDWFDRGLDIQHPIKKHRPLAAGTVRPKVAIGVWAILSSGALLGSMSLPHPVSWLIGGYILLNMLYSWRLKHIALLDVSILSIGFELRVFSGGYVSAIPVSDWLVLMIFLLSMLLGFEKRRADLMHMAAEPDRIFRPVLEAYSLSFLRTAARVTATILIVCYILYSISEEVVIRIGSDKIYLTSFFVIIGLLRYLQLTEEDLLRPQFGCQIWTDPLLISMGFGWMIVFGGLLYGGL